MEDTIVYNRDYTGLCRDNGEQNGSYHSIIAII